MSENKKANKKAIARKKVKIDDEIKRADDLLDSSNVYINTADDEVIELEREGDVFEILQENGKENYINDFAKEIEEMAKEHEENKPNTDKDDKGIDKDKDKVDKAINRLNKILDYLKEDEEDKCYTRFGKKNIEKKKEAKDNVAKKALRKIGEVLNVTITITYDATKFLINLLTKILHSAVEIICNVAFSISGYFTKLGTC